MHVHIKTHARSHAQRVGARANSHVLTCAHTHSRRCSPPCGHQAQPLPQRLRLPFELQQPQRLKSEQLAKSQLQQRGQRVQLRLRATLTLQRWHQYRDELAGGTPFIFSNARPKPRLGASMLETRFTRLCIRQQCRARQAFEAWHPPGAAA